MDIIKTKMFYALLYIIQIILIHIYMTNLYQHTFKSSQVYLYRTFHMAYIDTMCFEWRDDIKLSKINKHT